MNNIQDYVVVCYIPKYLRGTAETLGVDAGNLARDSLVEFVRMHRRDAECLSGTWYDVRRACRPGDEAIPVLDLRDAE
jgi:hypothetical protein